MQYLSIVLGLAAAASAIDVRIHAGSNCDRGAYECLNLTPNRCCYVESGLYGSIGFYGVPTNWNIECRGHSRSGDNRCGVQKVTENLSGGTFKCLRGGGFTGAGYGFRGKKRSSEVCDAETSGQTCTEFQKADVIVLEDGKKYLLSGMEESLLDELVQLAMNGTVAADIPEGFKKFEKAE
ncbi:uncharacterized protein K460DRAFT_392349 [Cucurbitaria berberidis CBS 394.84]|uniref:Uncharacterized protein n=1 Tax=Cucurbitaria berberidis CBS 394.84 TaxID=1168544 RepID=A0A9P4L9A8_9PLEO|nr:uncharacterized protein K460DRAFT_392349 [Cucurbitaria berberidis CBS 394.84]KAF1846860.1 hypothetical protein K460DRAFT_392349 [Cucurbitaria berberidis CBS 394.84]